MKKLIGVQIFVFLLFIMSCNKPDAVIPATKAVKKSSHFKYKQSNITNLTYTKANKHIGKMLYVVPKDMEVRRTYQILVRVSNSCVNIYENLDSTEKLNFIPTTDAMQVKLIDPSPIDDKKFSIVENNDAIQVVDSTDSYTEWSWDVTPVRAGKAELKTVVSNITDGAVKETVYTKNVNIQVNILKQLWFWVNTYWQWLFATLLAPLTKFFYDQYALRKKHKKHVRH